MLMTEQAAILDDLLAAWHAYGSSAPTGTGYCTHSLVCGDYRTSRQYDDENGALDGELHKRTMQAVDFAISQLEPMHRYCIQQEARNLHAGRNVFISPRLPKDKAIRMALIAEARSFLAKRLQNAGVF